MSATTRLLRPLAIHNPRIPLAIYSHTRSKIHPRPLSTNFNPTAFTSPPASQTLTAHRTLDYTPQQIFDIIADISSYPSFIPYMTAARVSQYSVPDARLNKRWPQTATLSIGYSSGPVDVNESFTSRVFCVPPGGATPEQNDGASTGYVEALSGTAVKSALDETLIAHHLKAASGSAHAEASASPVDFLRTLWTIRPVAGSATRADVSLSIEYRFRNIMFDMLGATVAPRLADGIVGVFEARLKRELG